ncbi:nitroreductase family deazaflavin-dependent oxidoreductase [Saccharomonospora sp. NB11]|jgi:deazaflavin-dependent oxidoreductase (nitroreductase family)|uniref:nitroreductase family deazaflavin-dependent oxidoreductase n=1 Tax=Saccharomonospora sp. NB11 TaxID=1642298 RepID=UPI0018D12678|nr:nitroreductase family deazaflavin-dependent oxidoreductase [Saccharomonospora sp. NB11]
MSARVALARFLGSRRWVMRLAPLIVRADRVLHRFTSGRVTLLRVAGVPTVRLTTVGRRSGVPRQVQLLCLPLPGAVVVVGSNWGRPRDPAWVHNLRARPEATVTIGGRTRPVRAREVTGAAYERLWPRLLRHWPGYGAEREWAGRELPVFVLDFVPS